MKNKLWCDLETAKEKAEFFRSGRAWETGIVARALEDDLAEAFDTLVKMRKLIGSVDSFDDLEWVRRHADNSQLRREVLEDLDYSDMCDIIEGYWQLVQKLEKLMNEQN